MHGQPRTGVRFVLSNCADPAQRAACNAWYDTYASRIVFPGLLVNAWRFENASAADTDADPRYAALYDMVSDPGPAWPATAEHPDYPVDLFDDPRAALVSAPFRTTYALDDEQAAGGEHGPLTGVVLVLSPQGPDAARAGWTKAVLASGLFASAAQFHLVEGEPDPPGWLEVLETGEPDPAAAYAQATARIGAPPGHGYVGVFRLHSAYPPLGGSH